MGKRTARILSRWHPAVALLGILTDEFIAIVFQFT